MNYYRNPWEPIPPYKHMRNLCAELGKDYRIRVIDAEQCIYRDFGNGYDLEISEVNTTSSRKKATLYLWRDANCIVKKIIGVPQKDIGKYSEWLKKKAETFTPDDFGTDGFPKYEPRTVYAEDVSFD